MSKKRRMILIAGLVMSMTAGASAAAVLSGCKPAEAPKVQVTGVFYDEANDCLVELDGSDFTFKLTMAGSVESGEYTYDGNNINFSVDGGWVVGSLNQETGVMTFSYNNKSCTLNKTELQTLSFNTDGGSAVATQNIVKGKKGVRPADPTKSGYIFVDWYDSSSYGKLFDFNADVSSNKTAYARFEKVDSTKGVYTVKFQAGDGATVDVTEATTVNETLYKLPVPVKSGATFVGWWASDYQDASKLTAQYKAEQRITQDLTLFAVWKSDAPAVSVTSTGVNIEAAGVTNSYKIAIYDSENNELVNATTGSSAYAYDFTKQDAGDYSVSVTLNNKTTVAYYKNKALSRPSNLKVIGNTLSFGAVAGASEYLISVVCGNGEHVHTDLSLGTETSYDFSSCEMKEGGISFTVKAVAEGFATSVSDELKVERNLSSVSGLAVNPSTEVVSWNEVANAENYKVVIKNGSTELFNGIARSGEISLKNYGAGSITVAVVPLAHGYNSPAASEIGYNKSGLATPSGIKVNGYVVSWDAVDGAQGYTVKINGTTYTTSTTSYDFSSLAGSQSSLTLSVCATGTNSSIYSDEITFNTAINNAEYNSGKVSWNAVLGAVKYGIKVGDADIVFVEDGVLSANVTFTQKGNVTIKIFAYNQNDEIIGAQTGYDINVTLYAITFNSNGGNEIATKYLATGDKLELPKSVYAGYELDGWYDAAGGAQTAGKKLQDGYFTGTSDVTYYAYWVGKEFGVTLSVDSGASVDTENATVKFGKDFSLPVPTHSDTRFAFAGWYTENNGEGTQFTDEKGNSVTTWNKYSDTTLYAYWYEIYSFTLLENGTYSVSKGSQANIESVTEITIPAEFNGKRVSVVEGAAFQSCTKLLKINIPSTISLVAIGLNGGNAAGSAFQGCSKLQEVNVYFATVEGYSDEALYESYNGALICHRPETGEVELAYYPYGRAGEYTIPNGVTKLPINVFKSCSLTKITIPASVTSIDDYAFYSNSKLTEVVFTAPEEGQEVQPLTFGEEVFKNCSKLTKVTFPARMAQLQHEVEKKTVYNDFFALFMGCSKLAEVYMEGTEGFYSSTSDGVVLNADGSAILYCPIAKAGAYTIPNGVSTIGEKAFYKCTKLTSLTIPAYVTEIGVEAFRECSGLTSLKFLGTERDGDLAIRERAFYKCCTSSTKCFKEVVLPANLTVLEKNAFGYCTYLTTVTVNCDRLAEEMNYASSAFNKTEEDGGNSYVVTVNIGQLVNAFDVKGVFGGAGSKLTTVNVDPNNANFTSISGVLFNKEVTEILFYPSNRTDATYELPATVTRIGANVFAGIQAFTSFEISTNIEDVSEGAFSGCKNLEEVTFVNNRTANLTVGDNAFKGCLKLIEITFPEKTTAIGAGAFAGCVGLETVNLPASIESLGGTDKDVASIFEGCDKFSNINLAEGGANFASADGVLCGVKAGVPDSVLYSPVCNSGDENGVVTLPATITSVADSAFSGNAFIKEVKFAPRTADSKITIGTKAFYRCTALETIHLPVGLETIESLTFFANPALKTVSLPYTVKTIKIASFAGCEVLDSLTFDETPAGVDKVALSIEKGSSTSYSATITEKNEIKCSPFSGCAALGEVIFPDRLKTIGDYAFYKSGVTAAYFPSTLTSIGLYAFDGCATLNTAVFAASAANVTIGNYAFRSCDLLAKATGEGGKITGLVLPTKLTTIGTYAFQSNKNLTSVELPSTLTKIDGSAFRACSALQSIVLPNSVTTLGTYVFYGCASLESVTLSTQLTTIPNDCFEDCVKLDNVVIPDKVTSIGNWAFDTCTALKTITLNNGLKSIGNSAFTDCTSLETITIPASIETLGNSVFNDCTSLTSIVFATKEVELKKADEQGNEVTYTESQSNLKQLGNTVFQNAALTSFTFPISSNAQGINTIGNSLFKGCEQLTTLTLSRSVTNIGAMLEGCYSITTLAIAEGSKNLSMSSTIMPSDAPLIFNLEGTVLKKAYGVVSAAPGTYTIPEGITGIDDYALNNQNNIIELVLPSTLTKIGNYAFQNCRMLKSVKINVGAVGAENEGSSNLTEIGDYAFDNCISMRKITVGDGADGVLPSKLTKIGKYAFSNIGLEAITIPQSVTTIGEGAFAGAYALKTAYQLSTVFSKNMFLGDANLKTVYLRSDLTQIGAATTMLSVFERCTALDTMKVYNVTTKEITGNDGEVTFPSGLTALPKYAFRYSGVKKLVVPKALTTFNEYAFGYCPELTSVKFADDAIDLNIGKNAFAFDEKLTEVSGAVKTIGETAFAGCTGLIELTLPNCVEIGNYAFSGCTSLETIRLPKCEKIGTYAFGYKYKSSTTPETLACGKLKTVELATDKNINVSIGNYAFGYYPSSIYSSSYSEEEILKRRQMYTCCSLTDINFDRVVSIGNYAFTFSSFTEISLPVCETLGDEVFAGCTNLTKVTLSTTNDVTLGSETFGNSDEEIACFNLKEINTEKVVSIGTYCFENCTSLQGALQGEGESAKYVLDLSACLSMKNYAFELCTALKEVTLNSDLDMGTSTGRAFGYCSALEKVNGTVKSIGPRAFWHCEALKSIDLSQTTSIGYAAFESCALLTELDLSSLTDMEDYVFENCSGITSVTLGSNLTTLSNYAFVGCSNLETINLDAINAIGNYAFKGCENLTGTIDLSLVTDLGTGAFQSCTKIEGVILSNGLKEIASYAFRYCDALVYIEIPGSVESIGSSAFYGSGISGVLNLTGVTYVSSDAFAATQIEKVIFSDLVSYIGADSFGQCSKLTGFEVSEGNQWYQAGEDGVLYAKASEEDQYKTLVCYPGGKGGDVVIDANTKIAPYAFAGCNKITSITVPSDITEVSEYAFWAFKGEIEFTIPETVTVIKDGAFQSTKITEITLPVGLKTISKNAFRSCTSLTTIVIPEGVESIGDYAFASCSSLQNIVIPASVKSIGAHAFDGCSNLVSITLNEGLKTIGDDAFLNCTKLETISIPNNVETIGAYAFEKCSALTTATFGTNVGYLGTSAFYGCTQLTTVTFGDGFGTIGAGAFSKKKADKQDPSSGSSVTGEDLCCEKLTTVTFLGSVDIIGVYAFQYSGITEITLPAGMAAVYGNAFSYCEKLEKVTVLGDFEGTYDDTGKFKSGCGSSIFQYDTGLKQVIIGEGVTEIGSMWFYRSGGPTVSLPSTLETIPSWAFYMSKITAITLPEGLTKIGDYAFTGCTELASVNIPSTVTSIGDSCFKDTAITEITVPALTSVGDYVFKGCKKLGSVTLSEGLTTIGCQMFYGCEALTSIVIPSTVKNWTTLYDDHGDNSTANEAFGGTNVASITIKDGVTKIGQYAFKGSKITELHIPTSVTNLESNAFASCELLESIVIPASVTSCGSGIFKGCTSLKTVTFAEGTTKVFGGMFEGCTSVKTVVIPETVTYMGGAFTGWTEDQTVIIKTNDGIEKTTVNNSSYYIAGWLQGCGATIIVQTPSSIAAEGSND